MSDLPDNLGQKQLQDSNSAGDHWRALDLSLMVNRQAEFRFPAVGWRHSAGLDRRLSGGGGAGGGHCGSGSPRNVHNVRLQRVHYGQKQSKHLKTQ